MGIKKSFDAMSREFYDARISRCILSGSLVYTHLNELAPYVTQSKSDIVAIAKALGVTAEDLK